MLAARIFILVVLCCENVLCGTRKLCDFDNIQCLTNGARRTYQEYVNGDGKGVSSSDPLHLDLIVGDLPTLKYQLRNITFYGMKSCMPELVKIDSKDMSYQYHVACEHLTLEGHYEIKGQICSKSLEGEGDHTIDFYDYVFLFSGESENYIGEDEKLHLRVKNFNLDIDARGKVVYDYKSLYNNDTEKAATTLKFINDNWKEFDKATRLPTMKILMTPFMNNVNAYLKAVTIDYLFSYEE